MSSLLDECAAVPFATVRTVLEHELGRPVYWAAGRPNSAAT